MHPGEWPCRSRRWAGLVGKIEYFDDPNFMDEKSRIEIGSASFPECHSEKEVEAKFKPRCFGPLT